MVTPKRGRPKLPAFQKHKHVCITLSADALVDLRNLCRFHKTGRSQVIAMALRCLGD